MNTKVKKLILKGIILALISIPVCAKLINLSKYDNNVSLHNYYFSKGENVYPGTLIRLGNKGENVSKVQRRLKELGFNAGSSDGIFGNLTKTAVVNFQKSRGLDADGVIGSLTWKALFELTNTYPGTLIRLGSTGQNVVRLQQRLKELGLNVGNADGIFGDLTKTAIINFQRSKGLEVDGIVGQMTWNLLFSIDKIVEPSIPDKKEPGVQLPSDSLNKGNSAEDSNDVEISEDQDKVSDNPKEDNDNIYSSETVNIEELLNFASKYIGCPYKFGANGPDSFDSSGFTEYVYKNAAGIDIGRSTSDQMNIGKAVSKSELQPGDLVFPHSEHVGIYVGGGKMIHAPQTEDVIKVASVYKFYTARRVI